MRLCSNWLEDMYMHVKNYWSLVIHVLNDGATTNKYSKIKLIDLRSLYP